MLVFTNVYIDHDGSVVPCCNIRSDEPTHRPYVVDKLTMENSIFEAYANSALAEWRRSLFAYGDKQNPCSTCSHMLMADTPALRDQFASIRAQYSL